MQSPTGLQLEKTYLTKFSVLDQVYVNILRFKGLIGLCIAPEALFHFTSTSGVF